MNNILKLSISFLFAILFGYITVSLVNDTYSIENTDFEDINFYRCVVDAYNEENGTSIDYLSDKLTDEQLGSIKSVSCISSTLKITSIKGVEKLSSLTSLELNHTLLTSVDVSKNSFLIHLDVSRNNITKIVTNGRLEYLDVSSNYLENLTVDDSMKTVIADDNKIVSVNFNNAVMLEELNLNNNRLESINVSKLVSLKKLELKNNYLGEINVLNNVKLEYLDVSNGADYCLNGGIVTGDNKFKAIDVSKNSILKTLIIDNIGLDVIDIRNNLLLEKLSVRYNYTMASIDVTNNVNLRELDLAVIGLKEVDLSKNIHLEKLYLNGNFLNELDLSMNSKLVELYLSQNELVELSLANCPHLKVLYAYSNLLKKIDLSNNLLLEELIIYDNLLEKIDLSNHSNLKELDLYNATYIDENFSNYYFPYRGEEFSFDVSDVVKVPAHLGWNEPVLELNCFNECNTKINDDNTLGIIRDYNFQFIYKSDYYEITGRIFSVLLSTDLPVANNDIVINQKDKIIYTNKLDSRFIFNSLSIGSLTKEDDVDFCHLEINIDDMKAYIKCEEKIVKEFKIVYENYALPDTFGEKGINVNAGTNVSSLVNLLEIYENVDVVNKSGAKLSSDDLVSTGSKVKVKLYTAEYTYEVVVSGDVDGDGSIQLSDIMKVANYLYKDKNSLYNSYLAAADYDKNGKYELSDIMKMANRLYGKKT